MAMLTALPRWPLRIFLSSSVRYNCSSFHSLSRRDNTLDFPFNGRGMGVHQPCIFIEADLKNG
jgi:hypothetical protein